MSEEELKKPKLIWKGSVGEALKTGRLTQEQVDKWNMEEEMGEDYMNGFEEGFQKGKLEQKKEDIKLINGFEPTKSNMMYDEVCLELIKQIKGKEKGK